MTRFLRLVRLATVVGVLTSTPSVVRGQVLDSIPPNARVRIELPAADRARFHRDRAQSVVGTLAAVRADTLLLVVRPGGAPLRLPRAAVRSISISRGRPPRWRAALEGAVLPALITAAISAAGTSIHRKAGQPSPAQAAISSAAWAGGSAALFGAWSPKERWRVISQPDSIIQQAPSHRNR